MPHRRRRTGRSVVFTMGRPCAPPWSIVVRCFVLCCRHCYVDGTNRPPTSIASIPLTTPVCAPKIYWYSYVGLQYIPRTSTFFEQLRNNGPILMIFAILNPEKKFQIKILQICPPHLSDVATLPWEIQKSFSTVTNTFNQGRPRRVRQRPTRRAVGDERTVTGKAIRLRAPNRRNTLAWCRGKLYTRGNLHVQTGY